MKGIIFGVDGTSSVQKRSAGGHRLATFLRENGWDIEVIDFASYWSLDDLKSLAKLRFNKEMKWIGISCIFTEVPLGVIEDFLAWVKITYIDIKVIYGSQSQLSKKHNLIDYNINGFGEMAVLNLLKYLFSNGPAPRFSMFLNAGKHIAANEHYPSFPMKSLMIKYEDRDFIQHYEWLTVEFARGCKFQCDFCNFPVLGVKGDYTRDAEDLRTQLMDAYDRFGVENYVVADETFNDRTEKITKFADVVETLPFSPYFTGFIRADLAVSRPAEKDELLRMNFFGQFYGVDTFYHETGKLIGKGMNPDKLKKGLISLKEYSHKHSNGKYRGYLSFIAGLPREPITSLYETKQWLLDHWQGESFSIFALEIPTSEYDYPSKISMDYKKYGYRDASNDLDMQNLNDEFHRFHILTNKLIWKNDHMSIKDAARIAKEMDQMRDLGIYHSKVPNFSLIDIGLPESLEERLSLDYNYINSSNTVRMDLMYKRINDYIQKKLGL